MKGDANAVIPIIRTRSVRHLAVFYHGWRTLCGESRGPATPWVGSRTMLGLKFPGDRLGFKIKEVPLCLDCRAVAFALHEAVRVEDER